MGSIIERRILIGIATITATIILIGWIAINENARMEEFTERAEGRSIENGAELFAANCASCHGYDGLGLQGVAPALNNPVLFGYNFLGDVQSRILSVEAALESESDPERLAELQAELGALQAEETLLRERILYDWSDMVGASNPDVECAEADTRVNEALGYSDADLCEMGQIGVELMQLDRQIEENLDGVDRASNLPVYIGQREAQELAPLQAEYDDLQSREELSAEESERLAELEEELAALEEELAPYTNFQNQRQALVDRRAAFQSVSDANAEIQRLREELAEVESDLAALGEAPESGGDPDAQEREALTTRATELSDQIDALSDERQAAYDEMVTNGLVLPYDFDGISRLQQVGWAGTLYSFVEGTLIGGRPTSSSYWPNPMAAWAQETGGPLRPDQIRYLTEFVLNWERDFTVEDLRAVRQFARVPVAGDGAVASGGGGESVGNDVDAIVEEVAAIREAGEVAADPAQGQQLFTQLGCVGCHQAQDGTGPALTGMWSRAEDNEDNRLTETGHEGNPEAYLIESIVMPNNFVVPGFAPGIMPQTFGEQLNHEQLLNLLAYLQEQG